MHLESETKKLSYIVFSEIRLNFCTICVSLTDTAVNSLTQYIMQVATAALTMIIALQKYYSVSSSCSVMRAW